MKKLLTILIIFIQNIVFGNNLQLSDLQLIDGELNFNISWENSWNISAEPANHDAVWLFLKVKENGEWKHVNIDFGSSDFEITNSNLEVLLAEDHKGFFVKRKELGIGDISNTKISIPYNNVGNEIESIKIFGIEMVYIPSSSFYIGDGISYNSLMTIYSLPIHIDSENELDIEQSNIICLEDSLLPDLIPERYPKGFNGFYCMKYEISQHQYMDFLNTLTPEQQFNLTTNIPIAEIGTFAMIDEGRNRNAVVIADPANGRTATYAMNLNHNQQFNEYDDGGNIAMNWIKWTDLAAYLDWAALRPMTEMEFEKICRGNKEPVKGEFAWGTPYINDANTIDNEGQESEIVAELGNDTVGIANHGYDGVQGPIRCGFAAKENTNRVSSGASLYGIMEMSGNLWEQVISITTEGIQFTGNHGDGKLTLLGYHNVENWPDNLTEKGVGFKGGAWNSGIYVIGSFRDLAVSDRFYINWNPSDRRNTVGGRGVRTFNFE